MTWRERSTMRRWCRKLGRTWARSVPRAPTKCVQRGRGSSKRSTPIWVEPRKQLNTPRTCETSFLPGLTREGLIWTVSMISPAAHMRVPDRKRRIPRGKTRGSGPIPGSGARRWWRSGQFLCSFLCSPLCCPRDTGINTDRSHRIDRSLRRASMICPSVAAWTFLRRQERCWTESAGRRGGALEDKRLPIVAR